MISMKGYRNIEYFRGDRNSFIRIKTPRKWEIWWKGEIFEVVPTRKIARESIRAMQKGEDEMQSEDKAIYETARKAMKKLIVAYVLVGRLCERAENVNGPAYLVQEANDQLRVAQEEASELLGSVTRFLKHAGDLLV